MTFILRVWHVLLWSILPSGPLYFMSRTEDGTAILRSHPSHAKVSPLALQREWLHFSVILRPWVLVRSRESNPRPPALQSTRSTDWANTARSVRKIGIWILGLQVYNKLVKQGDDWWLDVCLAGRAKRGRMASLHCIQENKFLRVF